MASQAAYNHLSYHVQYSIFPSLFERFESVSVIHSIATTFAIYIVQLSIPIQNVKYLEVQFIPLHTVYTRCTREFGHAWQKNSCKKIAGESISLAKNQTEFGGKLQCTLCVKPNIDFVRHGLDRTRSNRFREQ